MLARERHVEREAGGANEGRRACGAAFDADGCAATSGGHVRFEDYLHAGAGWLRVAVVAADVVGFRQCLAGFVEDGDDRVGRKAEGFGGDADAELLIFSGVEGKKIGFARLGEAAADDGGDGDLTRGRGARGEG